MNRDDLPRVLCGDNRRCDLPVDPADDHIAVAERQHMLVNLSRLDIQRVRFPDPPRLRVAVVVVLRSGQESVDRHPFTARLHDQLSEVRPRLPLKRPVRLTDVLRTLRQRRIAAEPPVKIV